jgi:hypothetical protein
MVGHQEHMLKQAPRTLTTNTKITLNLCKMTINQLKFLQMLTIMAIIPIMTVHKLPVRLTRPGEVPILMFQ